MADNLIKVDIAIIGAGLVGLAAAIAMHALGLQVVIIDSQNPLLAPKNNQLSAQDWDTRIYTISPKNMQWLTHLGVWQMLNPSRIEKIAGMQLWQNANQTTREAPLYLSADDAYAQELGFVIEASALLNALLSKVQALGIQLLFDTQCETLHACPQQTILNLTHKKLTHSQLSVSLLLAADGANSWVRAQLNFPFTQKSYTHTAIVANFKAEKPHQHIARQWFMPADNGQLQVLAWLPLPENIISMVWSVPPVFASSLLAYNAEELSQKVAEAGQHLLGNFTLLNAPAGFPLALNKVLTPVQNSVILLGDAAHQVHPMAGQGVNLGFRDVEDLANILLKKNVYQAINDQQLLKQYERLRKSDVAKMVLLTDGLYQLFSSQSRLLKNVRQWGFNATKQQYLRALLVNQAVNM